MAEHVIIDDSPPTCIGVHYESAIWSATRHFQDVGFHGISGMSVMEHSLDCNEARRRALDSAKRGEGKCFWQGNWDYSASRCALYKFNFTSYDGSRFCSEKNGNSEFHVDWGEAPDN